MSVAQENDLVLLIGPRGKRFMIRLRAGASQHTHKGVIQHDALIGQPLGRQVRSHLGEPFLALEPSTHDLMMNVRRHTQIIYPKEAGYILLKMNLYNGRQVIEAGSGSGALALALARAVMPEGRIYSYESRPDMQRNAIRNLQRVGLSEYVEFKSRDIGEGFDETDVDALFLDVRSPWDYLEQSRRALRGGGFFGALVPTTNQVSNLVAGLERHRFGYIEVEELLLRPYKPVPERLRPADTMVGHTGYLIFARKIELEEIADEASPPQSDEASPDDAPTEGITP
ncbi:MAG: tRNA (adenine-N1)-methyltransferase [Anaerolineales bacterium]|nr:MAG: tRNA (adenine-N1)-methyltransferase [Anaerolineales bacterium]